MHILEYFEGLYKEKSQLALLTWAYSIVAIAFVLVAGIFALFSQPLGVSLLIIPLVAIIALCANVVVWALIRFAIDSASSRVRARQNRRKNKTKSTKTRRSAKKT